MRPLLALAFIAFALRPVFAENAGAARERAQLAADAKVLERCALARFAGGKGESCVGLVSGPCLKRAKDNGAAVQCHGREAAGWLRLVDAYSQRVVEHLDGDAGKTEAFGAARRAFAESRDASCAFIATFVDGSMAYPWVAACEARENARRTLYLLRLVDYAGGL